MNGDDNRFFTMPENDPLLDLYLNDKRHSANGEDYRYALVENSEEDRPIDIGLFRSNEYPPLKQ